MRISKDIIDLDIDKQQIYLFLESKMMNLCPNVTKLVGIYVASRLIAAAGGIKELSVMPPGNI